MSVYDFNQPQQEERSSNNHVQHGTSNGTQARYNHHQVENDYLNRGFSSTHNLDMSLQVTRPTSKTALLVRQRRSMLEQLSCFLCKGYLIDATTVDECMDSFCKSCIIIYLRSHNNCPKCGTLIHKTNPLSSIRSDKVLQDTVYKLVPGLYDDEMKRRRDFYRNRYAISSDEEDEDGSSCSFNGRLTGEQYGVITHPKPFYKPTDHIDLSIEPHTRGDSASIYYDNKRQSIVTCFTSNKQQQHLPQGSQLFSPVESVQFKTYLRCPAKLTALQLKKFIASKFNICKDDTIHLLYLNESLKDEYSLIDIAYIYDWRGIEHMRLFYIIERDLGKSYSHDSNNNQHIETSQLNNRIKTRQSVGTSTQTVKRVCIDPRPKFYEANSDNSPTNNSNSDASGSNMDGRLMRSRTESADSSRDRRREESSTSSNRATSSHTTHSPILRSNSSSRTVITSASTVNGVSSRDVSPQLYQTANTPLASAVASAVDELSRLKQERETKELRSSVRRINNESSTGSIPKININLSSINQSTKPVDSKNLNTYSRVNQEVTRQKEPISQNITSNTTINHNINGNIRQLVPWKGNFPPLTSLGVPGPSHSSMVTMASFSQARNNNVVTMSSSTATTISNNLRNTTSSITPTGYQMSSIEGRNNINQTTSRPPQATPQLAFSFVTERGITIIRRLNNNDEAAAIAAVGPPPKNVPATTSKASSTVPSIETPATSSQSSGSNIRRINASNFTPSSQTSYSIAGTSSGNQTNLSSSGQEGISQRHLIKVKPVYKTFVDPTKLKSPNFKKLGYTARH